MEEISLEEFISGLGESYQKIFELLEDEKLINFAKSIVPIMKKRGLEAATILFDEDIKAQVDTITEGSSDKLLAIETLLIGLEQLEHYFESLDAKDVMMDSEDAASRMVTYHMIQYILGKKANKNVQ